MKTINEYVGNYNKIDLFILKKIPKTYYIYVINKEPNISILISPESSINTYSIRINLNKIKNKKKHTLNIIDCFKKNKVSIYDENDSEVIITIELEEIYTNINLLEFGEKEKYIYSLNAKKNKYNVLWKDSNFGLNTKYDEYLNERAKFAIKECNMNIFCIRTLEDALKFVIKRRKKNDNFIFISSIGKEESGRRFIEIVRKIYNFDVIVLFFSNNKDHFEWIKDFPNCLYTDRKSHYENYLTNYNIEGLKMLRKEIKEEYKLDLKEITPDALNVPLNINIINQKYNPYLRHVKIFSEAKNQYLCMIKDGENGKVIAKNDGDGEGCFWDATFLDETDDNGTVTHTITLYSNNFYLKEEKNKATGSKYMVKWDYRKFKDSYYFICREKYNRKILSVEGEEIKVNKKTNGIYELFKLINVDENEKEISLLSEDNSFLSHLSKRIRDVSDSASLNGTEQIIDLLKSNSF